MNSSRDKHIRVLLLLSISLLMFVLVAEPNEVSSAAFVVDSNGDSNDINPGDGICASEDSVCTLRAAIQETNAIIGADTITFMLPSGQTIISPLTALPPISDTLTIDATTQPGTQCATMFSSSQMKVVINGSSASLDADGLFVAAGSGSAIRGLAIGNFSGNGVRITADNTTVSCNHIGTSDTGTIARPNDKNGVFIEAGSNNLIGGYTAAARNVISANSGAGVWIGPFIEEEAIVSDVIPTSEPATDNIVAGNYIGSNNSGVAAFGNGQNGISVLGATTLNNVIGGETAGAGNLISGNLGAGVGLLEASEQTFIAGNRIGTNVLGNWALGNALSGVLIENSANNHIADNLISGNSSDGITIADPPSSVASINNLITANLIGTNHNGMSALPNAASGIFIQNASYNTVGGSAEEDGNIISGNGGNGILVQRSPNFTVLENKILSNTIGIATDGMTTVGNISTGISMMNAQATLVQGNIIGGNAAGITLQSPNTENNVIIGNWIGTDPTGTYAWGNGEHGIFLNSLAHNTTIGTTSPGEGNVIAKHSGRGIWMTGVGTNNNSIRGNSIYDNQGDEIENKLGIDLAGSGVNPNDLGDADDGANHLQNYPNIIGVYAFNNTTLLNMQLNSTPNATFNVDIYLNEVCDASGYGEGQQYLMSTEMTTDGFGSDGLVLDIGEIVAGMPFVTTTATDQNGNTSEFSNCVEVIDAFVVTSTNDADDGECNLSHCSLREAIMLANELIGLDTIAFAIQASGPQTIVLSDTLDVITDPVVINGLTQPGGTCPLALAPPQMDILTTEKVALDVDPLPPAPPQLSIELDGSLAGIGAQGLVITAGGSTVRGLAINNFDGDGVVLEDGGNNVLECSIIGLDIGGTDPLGNGGNGLVVDNSAGNRIGAAEIDPLSLGDEAVAATLHLGNVIADNDGHGILVTGDGAVDNELYGNVIGLDLTATMPLGNGLDGIHVEDAPNIAIGRKMVDLMNFIGANGENGISLIGASDAQVIGNFVGADASGVAVLGNGENGVLMVDSFSAMVAYNLVAGNGLTGMTLNGESNSNSVTDNIIGSDIWALSALSNGSHGLAVTGYDNVIQRNTIFYNMGHGVVVEGELSTGNHLLDNKIFGNLGLGIDLGGDAITANDVGDLDTGANLLQNYPEITDVVYGETSTTIIGTLDSTAATTFTLQFFASPFCDPSGMGEGYMLLVTEEITTGVDGLANFEFVVPEMLPAGMHVTATAVDPVGNTSEFSACVPEAGNFAELLLSPLLPTRSALPGDTATYEFSVMNLGNVDDTYTLSATGDWEFDLSAVTTPLLQPGQSFEFTLTVTVPSDAVAGVLDETTITAKSVFDEFTTRSAVGMTVAEQFGAVTVDWDTTEAEGKPGEVVNYHFTVTNNGNGDDNFVLSFAGEWDSDVIPPSTGVLGMGETFALTLTVTIPITAVVGVSDVTTVTATSLFDMTMAVETMITTRVVQHKVYLPIVVTP